MNWNDVVCNNAKKFLSKIKLKFRLNSVRRNKKWHGDSWQLLAIKKTRRLASNALAFLAVVVY